MALIGGHQIFRPGFNTQIRFQIVPFSELLSFRIDPLRVACSNVCVFIIAFIVSMWTSLAPSQCFYPYLTWAFLNRQS